MEVGFSAIPDDQSESLRYVDIGKMVRQSAKSVRSVKYLMTGTTSFGEEALLTSIGSNRRLSGRGISEICAILEAIRGFW